ncbi:MAG TPA: hypothetical protein VFN55_06320 [Solirubrobacteraceae bacterium]|nr:hypothetical protein [Solirubrobacteraceae bacterium]
MNTANITRDDWIIGGVALLLVIDLLFLPWFDISAGPFSLTLTATDAPSGWAGILAVLLGIALIADLAVERMSPQTTLPALNGSRTETRFALACAVALFVFLKFVFNIHFSDFGFGFWLGVILTAGLVYVALQARHGKVGIATGV